MTNKVISKVVVPLLECPFDVNETMRVLTHNRNIFYSWGVSKRTTVLGKGLILQVHGRRHSGDVLITLGWDDTYQVRIMSNRGTVLHHFEMVYVDMLVQVIDNHIEYIPEYH